MIFTELVVVPFVSTCVLFSFRAISFKQFVSYFPLTEYYSHLLVPLALYFKLYLRLSYVIVVSLQLRTIFCALLLNTHA